MSTYLKAGALIEGIDTTVTSGGTTALIATSKTGQQFTGTSNQIVTLPDATTLASATGYARRFEIANRSTGSVTVNNFSGTLLATLAAGTQQTFLVTDTSTSSGVWALTNSLGNSGGVASVAGSDELKMLQSLANFTLNDGTIAAKPVLFNPEEMGSDYWISNPNLLYPLRGAINHGFTLNGYGYIPSGQTTGNTFSGTSTQRFDADNNYWLARAAVLTNTTNAAGFAPQGFGYLATGWTGSADISALQQYNDSTNAWAAKLSITLPRFETMGYTIQNTYGMVAGGRTANASAYTATCEIYDPTTLIWTSRASMSVARASAGQFEIQGIPHAILGFNAGGTAPTTSEKLDTASNTWVILPTNIQTDRDRMVSFQSCDRGYVATGQNNANSTQYTTVEYFAPSFGGWVSAAPMPAAQREASSLTINHLGIAAGGFQSSVVLSTVTIYKGFNYFNSLRMLKTASTPTSILLAANMAGLSPTAPAQIRTDGNAWKNLKANDSTSLLKLNESLSTKFATTGMGMVAGGATGGGFSATLVTQSYNDVQDIWSARASIGSTIINPGCYMLNGEMYMLGGGSTSSGPALQTSQKFNDLTNAWTARASFSSSARGNPATFVLNELGYMAGGDDINVTVYSALDQYSPVLNAYVSKTAMTAGRHAPSGFDLNNRGYAVGGGTTTGGGSGQTQTYQYDSELNAWATKNTIPAARMEMGGTTLNGFGYSTCGRDTSPGPTNTRYKYNDQTDSWSSVIGLATNKTLHTTFRAAGQVFDAGGRDPNNNTTTYAYNDAANTSTSKSALVQSQADVARSSSMSGSYRVVDIRIGVPAFFAGVGGGVWLTRANLTTTHNSLPAFGAAGGFGFCIAGGPSTNERYDRNTNSVMVRQVAPNGTNSPAGFSLNGTMFVHGGSPTNTTCVTNNDEFVDEVGIWVSRAALPSIRGAHSGETLNNFGYAISGASSPLVTGASSDISNTDQYSQSTNSWASRANVGTASSSLATATYDGWIYKFCGQIASSAFTNIAEKYNDSGNTWTNIATSSQSKYGARGVTTSTEILLAGGITSGPTYQSTVESYKPAINVFILKASMTGNRAFHSVFSLAGDAFVSAGINPTALTTIDQYATNLNPVILGIALEVK